MSLRGLWDACRSCKQSHLEVYAHAVMGTLLHLITIAETCEDVYPLLSPVRCVACVLIS